jgi:hypothetical protein
LGIKVHGQLSWEIIWCCRLLFLYALCCSDLVGWLVVLHNISRLYARAVSSSNSNLFCNDAAFLFSCLWNILSIEISVWEWRGRWSIVFWE